MNTIFKITTLAAVLVLLACGSEPEVSVAESCTGNHRPTWCNNIRSEAAADLLESNGITVNKNGVPNDPRSFVETSGIRLGTAAETTRGHDEE